MHRTPSSSAAVTCRLSATPPLSGWPRSAAGHSNSRPVAAVTELSRSTVRPVSDSRPEPSPVAVFEPSGVGALEQLQGGCILCKRKERRGRTAAAAARAILGAARRRSRGPRGDEAVIARSPGREAVVVPPRLRAESHAACRRALAAGACRYRLRGAG